MNLKNQLKECDDLYEKDDFKGLIKKCDEILEEFPDNQIAIGYKGFAYLALEEDDRALEILERGVELYPKNYYLKNNLAMVYYKRGEYETSLKLCEEGLKIKNFDWLCENKFKNLIGLGRYDEAIEFERTCKHHISTQSIFFEDDMGEHELNYYLHLLKANPDDSYIIDMIKMVSLKRALTPEVGDYHLKWIDAIRCKRDKTQTCPDCGGELIPILNGYPSFDALEKAERDEIHMGGCVIGDNANYHCKSCKHDFHIDDGDVEIECENPGLEEYARFKMLLLASLFRSVSGKCVKADEIKQKIMIYDDGEFDAFMKHLMEMDYIVKAEDDCFKLAGDKTDENKTSVDNSRLEELIKQDITPQMQREFLEILKKSRLFLPVDFGPDAFEGIEDAKPGDEIEGPGGFSIRFLTDSEGKKAVPLFTSEEMMRKAGARTSVMVMHMGDLADMLRQTDRYSVIAINPFTEFDLNMPIEAFLSQFEDEIEDIRNDELRAFLHKKELSEEDAKQFGEKLLNSVMITGCVDADDGTSFVLIWNSENKPHLPLFTDIDEFKKIFDDYGQDVYPQAYRFTDLMKVAKRDVVINPASESLVFDLQMFKA